MGLLGEHLHGPNTPKLPLPQPNPRYGSPTSKHFWGSPLPRHMNTKEMGGDLDSLLLYFCF